MGTRLAMSSDLLWALTKNKNSFKYSGLANLEAVGVEDNTRGVTLTTKNTKNKAAPKRNNVSVPLKKDFRKVAKTIRNKTEGKFYRKDLTNTALARWYKIWKAQNRATDEE